MSAISAADTLPPEACLPIITVGRRSVFSSAYVELRVPGLGHQSMAMALRITADAIATLGSRGITWQTPALQRTYLATSVTMLTSEGVPFETTAREFELAAERESIIATGSTEAKQTHHVVRL